MNYQNFVELTRQHAATSASKTTYTFLRDTGRAFTEETSTYSELDYAARNIASHLQKHRCFNQRVLLLYPSGLEFIKAFLGCLYAGAVAVPATLPSKQGQHLKRVFGIIHDADVAVVMTSNAYIETIKTWLEEEGVNQLPCLATDDLPKDLSNEWVESKIEPDHLAFLQYTSGSTSEPKGVMVSHKNLLSNEKSIKHGFGLSDTTKFAGWLPFYHDMGLIGNVLHPLYLGVPAVLMSPMAFLKRPARWLQAISDYRSTCSGGPNFAYDLCTQRVTDEQLAKLDLSSWEVAFNGSEPIRAETLKAFSDRFAITGFSSKAFYPCYGLAESTLFVSGGPKDKIPTTITVDSSLLEQNEVRVLSTDTESKTRTLVSSGIVQDLNMAIVNPETKERLAENQVGEVWINGDSVAQGYWKLDELTEKTFNAKIFGEEGLGYFRTGDLGFFNGGELFITGRIKEVIIINGRNLYPYDIEREVQAINPVLSRPRAAFSVDVGQEELVIVQEINSSLMSEAELKEIALRVKQSIGQSFEVQLNNIVFIKQGSLNKTTSGKIQRKLTKNLFLDNKLDVVFQERSASLCLGETVV
jgi:acyl-CoA synthetase (AMP-forming)/AMP-acid ligase II